MSDPGKKKRKFDTLMLVIGLLVMAFAWRRLGPSLTFAIGAGAATICAIGGAVIGSGIGIATAGVGFTAAVPLAVAGASACGWAGPALAALGIGVAPPWALPVFLIGGGCVFYSLASKIYYLVVSRKQRRLELPR